MKDTVSGDGESPVVDFLGSPMSALLHAIPAVSARTGRDVILIGGLAVVCRLILPTVPPVIWTR
jgi:hypothetical protein